MNVHVVRRVRSVPSLSTGFFGGLGMFSLMTVHRQRVFTSTSPFHERYVRFLWSLVASRRSICVPRSSKRIAKADAFARGIAYYSMQKRSKKYSIIFH